MMGPAGLCWLARTQVLRDTKKPVMRLKNNAILPTDADLWTDMPMHFQWPEASSSTASPPSY